VDEISGAVTDNTAENRLELTRDGETAELVYRVNGERLVLVHTEVPESLAGHGIGGLLVRAAVARAARDGMTIVPVCPYARQWLEKHPDVVGDVTVDWEAD
jgi:predicted GNAT family acetyltransferase